MMIGYALIAFGLGFLLREVGILTDTFWQIIWPLLLIAFGIALISKKNEGMKIF